jgi:hypothetical protein
MRQRTSSNFNILDRKDQAMSEPPKKKRRYINDLPPLPLPRFPEKSNTLKAIEETAFKLSRLPQDERAAAALRAFPPSGVKEALWYYARGATPADACQKAGANQNAFELYLKGDSVGYDLRQVMKGALECEYAPKAFAFLHAAVHDVNMPARVRVDSAKIIVNCAGYVAAPPAQDGAPKDLQELSLTELQKLIHDLERERAATAKDVSPPAVEGDESADDIPADDTPPH